MTKKKVPQIVKHIRNKPKIEIDFSKQKLVSYSQLSMYNDCPKKWSLQYKEGHKQFTSTIHTVFGTAIHEVIQHYLTVMYETSKVEANKINTSEMLKESLLSEYKKQVKLNNNTHFSNPDELREFFNDGEEIIRDFAKNIGKHFSKRGWYLVGCEIPITLTPNYSLPNVIYQGYLDVVLYHEDTNTIKIIDIKTSTSGWRKKEKSDENKQLQLVLYKKLFSEYFNFPIENIDIEFFIVKRKLFESEDFIIKRIQTYSPASGKIKVAKSTKLLDEFINIAFDGNGYSEIDLQPKINDNCKWCPFYKIHLCPATF